MDRPHYNRLKAASKQEQSGACIGFAEREQARTQFKIGLAEKERTGTWLTEQMGRNLGTVSRWMTNRSALWDASKETRCNHPLNSFMKLRTTLMLM